MEIYILFTPHVWGAGVSGVHVGVLCLCVQTLWSTGTHWNTVWLLHTKLETFREESAFLSSLRSATTDYWQAFLSPTAQQVIFLPVLGLTQANVLEQHKIGRHLEKKKQ